MVGSTFKDWADFRALVHRGRPRLHRARRRRCGGSPPSSRTGKTTRDEKLEALFDFVADDIRYVNYVSGEWWLPNRPQQLLARREGDCDDKALLLITLLKAVGIDAQEVMVQTRLTAQPSLVLREERGHPALRPRHRVPARARSGGTYLDATSPESRLGPAPLDGRARRGAQHRRGPAEIVSSRRAPRTTTARR